jgi:uncharacterized protein (DUF2147 family)
MIDFQKQTYFLVKGSSAMKTFSAQRLQRDARQSGSAGVPSDWPARLRGTSLASCSGSGLFGLGFIGVVLFSGLVAPVHSQTAPANVTVSTTATTAQAEPILGQWKTIDDKTKRAKSIVRIDLVDNKLHGTVVKLFREPGENPEPLCDGCKDYRKDKPVLGMTIMSGLKKSSSAVWEGGEIIDPADGSVYKVKVELKPDGKALDVRGYIGLPLIGRTQTWVRD